MEGKLELFPEYVGRVLTPRMKEAERTCNRRDDTPAVVTEDSAIKWTPPVNSVRNLAATSNASRVLPVPPVPVRVISRMFEEAIAVLMRTDLLDGRQMSSSERVKQSAHRISPQRCRRGQGRDPP